MAEQQHAPLSVDALAEMWNTHDIERSRLSYAQEGRLLFEVDRLRAENATLRVREAGVMQEYLHMQELANAENAALTTRLTAAMGIVRAVATHGVTYYSGSEGTFCVLCNGYMTGNIAAYPERFDMAQFHHKDDCPWRQARALVADMAAEQQAGES